MITMSDNTGMSLQKNDRPTGISKIIEIPINAKASIEIAIDRANAEARIKILQADIIVKYGLLHGKNKGEPNNE
jgi:hypothetical protein